MVRPSARSLVFSGAVTSAPHPTRQRAHPLDSDAANPSRPSQLCGLSQAGFGGFGSSQICKPSHHIHILYPPTSVTL